MKCCLCKKKIDVIGTWKRGHNALPLKDGRCCSKCNDGKVIPSRIKRLRDSDRLKSYCKR